ncbi:MAG: hypothetical protein ACXVYY_07485 [Oryzihumus sp.]
MRAGKAIGRAVGAAQLGCLVLAMVVTLIPADPSRLLVLAGRVVRPAQVGAALVAAAFVMAVLAPVVAPALLQPEPPVPSPAMAAGAAEAEQQAPSAFLPQQRGAGRHRRWTTTARRIGRAAVATAAVLCVAWAALGDAASRYLVLGPASPSGCRVVVDQRSFLLLGSGVVHVLRPGEHLTHPVGGYVTDDGYRPFDFGTYRLTWSGETATLELWGDPNMPVSPAHQRLPCS